MGNFKGIDISNNTGSVDFSQVSNDGVEYVYVKATEGKSYQDLYMAEFYSGCKENDLKVGAYHFLVSTSTPEAQAANFYSMIKDYEWDLIPMIDVETMSGFNENTLCDYVERFITAFNELSPLQLGIYTYTSFIKNLEGAEAAIKDMPFWEANYNDDPWNLADTFFTNRVGHQYTENGYISGVNGPCDIDAFTERVLLTDDTTAGEWILQDGKWWYKHTDGTYTKSGWEKIDGKWYLFDSEGYMEYDWKQDSNNWYYLGYPNDGAMKTGWIYDKNLGHWYYFNDSGIMQTGWINDAGKDYCLYSDGSMIHDTDLYGYRFDSNGVATKLS
jgi:GH25 family lysozyme M1 (1,4-beta-N-acetylmuramidase)